LTATFDTGQNELCQHEFWRIAGQIATIYPLAEQRRNPKELNVGASQFPIPGWVSYVSATVYENYVTKFVEI